jgi:C4-dicarboxylate transporter, DctM subunit
VNLATVSLTLFILLVIFLGGSVWIGISLFLIGIRRPDFLHRRAVRARVLSNSVWNNTSGSAMLALPMFVWMGEILFRSRISQNLFNGLAPWMDSIPGRLLHVNIIACTFFAAVSGSSAATTATVGRSRCPSCKDAVTTHRLSFGSLAGAGTLGISHPAEHDDAGVRHHRRCEHRQAFHRRDHTGHA